MSLYRVEKRELPVTLLFKDGTRAGGTFFLAHQSPLHTSGQTILELMAEPGDFLPCRNAAGEFVMVGKRALAAVSMEGASEDSPEFCRRVPSRLLLRGGHRVEGDLFVPGQEGGALRISDHLNLSEGWLCVASADAVVWVAKTAVVELKV